MMTYILIYIVCGAFWGLYFSLHKDNEELLNEYSNDFDRESEMRLLTGWMFAVYALTWPLWIVLSVIDIVLNVTNKVLKITK